MLDFTINIDSSTFAQGAMPSASELAAMTPGSGLAGLPVFTVTDYSGYTSSEQRIIYSEFVGTQNQISATDAVSSN